MIRRHHVLAVLALAASASPRLYGAAQAVEDGHSRSTLTFYHLGRGWYGRHPGKPDKEAVGQSTEAAANTAAKAADSGQRAGTPEPTVP